MEKYDDAEQMEYLRQWQERKMKKLLLKEERKRARKVRIMLLARRIKGISLSWIAGKGR